MKPVPEFYAVAEGSEWLKWRGYQNDHPAAHTIIFSDGSIFDMRNGWRAFLRLDVLKRLRVEHDKNNRGS